MKQSDVRCCASSKDLLVHLTPKSSLPNLSAACTVQQLSLCKSLCKAKKKKKPQKRKKVTIFSITQVPYRLPGNQGPANYWMTPSPPKIIKIIVLNKQDSNFFTETKINVISASVKRPKNKLYESRFYGGAAVMDCIRLRRCSQ